LSGLRIFIKEKDQNKEGGLTLSSILHPSLQISENYTHFTHVFEKILELHMEKITEGLKACN